MASEAAFRDYDFTSDDRWNRYRAGIEIPPGRDEEAILHKYKLKWIPLTRQQDPRQERHLRQIPSRTALAQLGAKTSTQLQLQLQLPISLNQTTAFQQQMLSLALHGLHMQLQASEIKKLSQIAWVYFLQTSVLTHGYKVYLKGGFPRFSRSAFLATLQSWLQRVGGTTDFQYLMLSAVFLPQQSVSLVIVPITVLAVYHAFAYCAKTFPNNTLWQNYGVRAHSFLAAHQRDALMYNAAAEIGTGFLLIVMLATQRRAILLTFLHWNWLRMRYFSPDAASYHSMVWGIIDQKVGPYIRQVSFLNTALRFGQRWFLSTGRP
ncbi:hypothetical protein WJX82_005382 [Trebouxia sp. C0006]